MVSKDMLSQDEIDALLKGTDDVEEDNSQELSSALSAIEEDALGEIGNISFGSSATALSTLLNQKVDITTPTVDVIYRKDLSDEFPTPYVAIRVSYTEGFTGSNVLVIQQSDAAIIADLMLGGNGENPTEMLGEIQLSAVQEAMNQMMGSSATSMSTIFDKKVDISPPSIDILDISENSGTNQIPEDDILVKVSFRLKIGELIDSNIMQIVPLHFAKDLVDQLMNPSKQNEDREALKTDLNKETTTSQSNTTSNQQNAVEQTTPMPNHLEKTNVQQPQVQRDIKQAEFTSFNPVELDESESNNLNMLLDIPLQVTVELGRTNRSVKEILSLSPGSIIELDKLAGEPVDILVNSKLIAKGEVVVIEENFGVRVTDILSKSDRIKKLR